jgi:hypothetical protein
MIDAEGQRIQELCQKVINEQDPQRILSLIAQLNALLEAKQEGLKRNASTEPKAS